MNNLLQDKMLGSSYLDVKKVASNIEYIKHVSFYLQHLYNLGQNINSLLQLVNITDSYTPADINLIAFNIPIINEVNDNLDVINNVNNNIDVIQNAASTTLANVQNANNHATAAQTSKDFAYKWANEPLDSLITEENRSGYSAFHWSEIAKNAANEIEGGGTADGSINFAKLSPIVKSTLQRSVLEFNNGVKSAYAFDLAHAQVPAGTPILVPAGSYDIDYTVDMTGRVLIFQGGATLTGIGRLKGAVIERIDPATGSRLFGTGVFNEDEYAVADYKFGNVLGNRTRHGIQIGGADPNETPDGTRFSLDSYIGWNVMQPTRWGSSMELAIQSCARSGIGGIYFGDNVLTTTYDMFDASCVGKEIAYGHDYKFLISECINANSVRVTTVAGAPVSWHTGYVADSVVMAYVGGFGGGTISGNTLTRTSGDPFAGKGIYTYYIRFGGSGTIYLVTATAGPSSATISGSPPQGNVSFEWWTDSGIISRLVVQRANGLGGPEELLELAAYTNKFRLQALSSTGTFPYNQRPFVIGNGYYAGLGDGERVNILFDGNNGDTFIGGEYDRYALRVTNREKNLGNGINIRGANLGSAPVIQAEGMDANVDLFLMGKANGKVAIGPSLDGTASGTDVVVYVKDHTGRSIGLAGKLV